MNDKTTVTFKQGETVPFPIEIDDSAVAATLTISDDEDIILQITEPFVDGLADIELSSTQTLLAVGTYYWQITLDYGDDKIIKLPDAECEDCSLPEIIVCAANDLESS